MFYSGGGGHMFWEWGKVPHRSAQSWSELAGGDEYAGYNSRVQTTFQHRAPREGWVVVEISTMLCPRGLSPPQKIGIFTNIYHPSFPAHRYPSTSSPPQENFRNFGSHHQFWVGRKDTMNNKLWIFIFILVITSVDCRRHFSISWYAHNMTLVWYQSPCMKDFVSLWSQTISCLCFPPLFF